jgi:Domain of unknown function (DUF5122) beta-propeller/Bacterial pre-peptidase C-terminal domain
VPPTGPRPTPPILNSRLSAPAQLYLDFDGETVTDPAWNLGLPIVAGAWILSTAEITDIFNRVKEDFLPFNINVTTDRAMYDATPFGMRMRCIITPTDTVAPGAGGVAMPNSFDQAGGVSYTRTIPCWVFNSTIRTISEAVSHELGHTLRLSHDGGLVANAQTEGSVGHENEYYHGYLSDSASPVGWAPIMGASYFHSVTQWSKGEYANANNLEDDVEKIADTINGFGYVPDEGGNSRATAVPLNAPSGVVDQDGVIMSATDSDFFSFTITTNQRLSFIATGASPAPNLDIALEIQNASGTVLGSNNPPTGLDARVTVDLFPGSYYIKVSGSGARNPLTTGYSTYGSTGAYTITMGGLGTLGEPEMHTLDVAHLELDDFGQAIAAQPDGKVLVAGYTMTSRGDYDFAVTRYKPGDFKYKPWVPDSAFGLNGTMITDFGNHTLDVVTSMALQNDGKILVAGYSINATSAWPLSPPGFDGRINTSDYQRAGFNVNTALIRYNSDGSLDDGQVGDSTPGDGFGVGGKVIADVSGSNDPDIANHTTRQNFLIEGA